MNTRKRKWFLGAKDWKCGNVFVKPPPFQNQQYPLNNSRQPQYTGGQSDLAAMQPSIEPQTTHHRILYVTQQVMERCTKRCNKWISLHLMSNKYFGSIWESSTNEIFPENSWTGKRPFVFANVKSILHCLLSSKTKPLKSSVIELFIFIATCCQNFNLSV